MSRFGQDPDPDPLLVLGRIQIRIRIRKKNNGSETLPWIKNIPTDLIHIGYGTEFYLLTNFALEDNSAIPTAGVQDLCKIYIILGIGQ